MATTTGLSSSVVPLLFKFLMLLSILSTANCCCDITAEFQAALNMHNSFRAQHGCPALSWDSTVAASAQAWADRGVFEHSTDRKYGENIGLGYDSASAATQQFYDEKKDYDWSNPGFGMATGHFTQVVWCGSQRLGIGKATAEGRPFYVFQYDPPGNVETQFPANVHPEGGSPSYASSSANAWASATAEGANAGASATAGASAAAEGANAGASATAGASAAAEGANAGASATAEASSSAASADAYTSSSANAAASADGGSANAFASAFASSSSSSSMEQPDGQQTFDASQGQDSQWQPSDSDSTQGGWDTQQQPAYTDTTFQSGRRFARRLGSFKTL